MGVHWDEFDDSGIKCPYCGNLYEVCETVHDGGWTCDECEREFDVEVEYTATYYTTKLETELEHQEAHYKYWLAPEDKHKEHAASIAKDYEQRIKTLKERIAKVEKQIATNRG